MRALLLLLSEAVALDGGGSGGGGVRVRLPVDVGRLDHLTHLPCMDRIVLGQCGYRVGILARTIVIRSSLMRKPCSTIESFSPFIILAHILYRSNVSPPVFACHLRKVVLGVCWGSVGVVLG